MRTALVVAAASLVLVVNGWSVWQAARNRTEARGGTLLLTGREVRPQTMPVESSVTVLRLSWRTEGSGAERSRPPAWLDTNKLAELGFDCGVPLSSPEARRHYDSVPSRRVFLALEYQADTGDKAEKPGRANTGLVVVDAARDPQQLRQRHPDPQQHAICRGIVRLAVRWHDRNGTALGTPVLEAWVQGLCPSELSVSRPTNRALLALHRTAAEFSARVHWGRNYEPWVEEIRPVSK
jgi:hypothetical protein